MTNEIGRELKVSDLRPRTIVWLFKEGREAMATMWVVSVGSDYVHFRAGVIKTEFLAARCGPGLESITDDSGWPMKIYEYLGKP